MRFTCSSPRGNSELFVQHIEKGSDKVLSDSVRGYVNGLFVEFRPRDVWFACWIPLALYFCVGMRNSMFRSIPYLMSLFFLIKLLQI